MSIKTKYVVLIFSLLFLVLQCKKSKMKNKCCNEEPVVEHFDGGYLGIPTVFTPNGDGENDVLAIYHKGIETFSLTIKNSVGTTIFETTDIDNYWDGQKDSKTQQGRFKLTIEAKSSNGLNISKVIHICSYSSEPGETMKCPDNNANCAFPNQWSNADSTFQKNIASFESFDCD
ncbi:MAG: hypothetical protein COC01_03180 [Bacteroidetes bacterium]|nr:MAG: hypothetical protein COC01_03180 [Bacteroidota bacterium]